MAIDPRRGIYAACADCRVAAPVENVLSQYPTSAPRIKHNNIWLPSMDAFCRFDHVQARITSGSGLNLRNSLHRHASPSNSGITTTGRIPPALVNTAELFPNVPTRTPWRGAALGASQTLSRDLLNPTAGIATTSLPPLENFPPSTSTMDPSWLQISPSPAPTDNTPKTSGV